MVEVAGAMAAPGGRLLAPEKVTLLLNPSSGVTVMVNDEARPCAVEVLAGVRVTA